MTKGRSRAWVNWLLGWVAALHLLRLGGRLWPGWLGGLACGGLSAQDLGAVFWAIDALLLWVLWSWPAWLAIAPEPPGLGRDARSRKIRVIGQAAGWAVAIVLGLPIGLMLGALSPEFADWLGWVGLWAWAAYFPWHYHRLRSGRSIPLGWFGLLVVGVVLLGMVSFAQSATWVPWGLGAIALASWAWTMGQDLRPAAPRRPGRRLVAVSGLVLAGAIGSYYLSIPRPETFGLYAPAYRAAIEKIQRGQIPLPNPQQLTGDRRTIIRNSIRLTCPDTYLAPNGRVIIDRDRESLELVSAEFVIFSIGLGDGAVMVLYRADGQDPGRDPHSLAYQKTTRLGDRWFWYRLIY